MIGKPTNTFDSRTIVIELRRAPPEKARGLRSLVDDSAEDLRLFNMGRKAARWIKDNFDKLAAARPDMGMLVNRPAMNWRPLFAVADLAGGTWPERAREAAATAAAVRADQDIKAELIIDLKTILDAAPAVDEWPSEVLVKQLVTMEGRPWAELGKARKPITQSGLARWLKPFGIGPENVGPEDDRKKGYRRWQFADTFASYAPPAPPPDSKCPAVQKGVDAEQVSPLQVW